MRRRVVVVGVDHAIDRHSRSRKVSWMEDVKNVNTDFSFLVEGCVHRERVQPKRRAG